MQQATNKFGLTANDPVCGASVGIGPGTIVSVREGQSYYFCSTACRSRFAATPGLFIAAASDAPRTMRHCKACGTEVSLPSDQTLPGAILCEACFLDRCGNPNASIPVTDPAAFAEVLVEALDLREHETGLHSRRVACHTLVLARRFDDDAEFLRQIYVGALLHDLGKLGIPDHILLKAGALTDAEWRVMRSHPEKGYELLRRVPGLESAAELVFAHEERFDGGGYPRGLSGDAIPLGARLFAVIDTLDAITSDRPYRRGLSFERARKEILNGAGCQFDPLAVEAFLAEEGCLREMVAHKCTLGYRVDSGRERTDSAPR